MIVFFASLLGSDTPDCDHVNDFTAVGYRLSLGAPEIGLIFKM
jgi:hypothetical protein